ncbi:MAG: preprotein translocase subunit SecY [Neisseriales bacterium]|nr:MAG: preprotein translocase subunit SecY [Neisseriales bacterium]
MVNVATGTDKYQDLRHRLLFLIGALVVYRIGAHIPVPGIDPMAVASWLKLQQSGIFEMLNMFSGGAISRSSIFAIGIMPYISASIVMQLVAEMVPNLKQLKKEGEAGRRKITQYTRYGTVFLASLQSFAIAIALFKQPGFVVMPKWEFYVTTVVCLVTGTMFLMWLGEQITERGLGNGISLIICAGIASGVPPAMLQTLSLVGMGLNPLIAMLLFLIVISVTYLVVFFESAQRKVLVNYAKRQIGNRVMQGQSTHIALKINMSGVIPPIFASSIILFPMTMMEWFGGSLPTDSALKRFSHILYPGQLPYVLIYAAAIVFFCYFYTALVFSPKEMADNLKKSDAFVPGIRPGEQTSRYLENVLLRLTLIGSVYVTAICLLPEFLRLKWSLPFTFGGTSLLIIVVVAMDFKSQIQSYMFSHQYESLLKKANFKMGVSSR